MPCLILRARFLQAVGVWCFIEPSRIAPGGVSGIALMLNHLFALPIGAVSLVINIPADDCRLVPVRPLHDP